MQRLGGGGYTRKRKSRGGGNDPTCGCDMRAGWPADLKAQGGGGCGCGGTCPLMNGGGMPVPDACPFAGTGMCGFYAKGGGCGCTAWMKRGGANPKSISGSIEMNNGSTRKFSALFEGKTMNKELKRMFTRLPEGVISISYGPYGEVLMDPTTKYVWKPFRGDFTFLGKMKMVGEKPMGLNTNVDPPAHPSLEGGRYKPTKKNLAALRRWKQGKSIGFTMKASLKAKGLIPRTSRKHRGKKIISNKYK